MEGLELINRRQEYRQTVDVVRSVPLTDILRPTLSGSTLSVPLNSGLPYTQFKYVSGIPSSEAGSGYSISKLQALDILIDRLVALQKQDTPASQEMGMSDAAVDELIKELGKKLSVAMSTGLPGLQKDLGVQMGTPVSHTGMLVNSLV